jgi:LmbE family N-acetylglucosaminyl deacetylase
MVTPQSIMAVGAHADDIEVGCGGSLAKYHDQGYGIVYVMSTNNMSGNVQERQPDGSIKRWKETPGPMMARRKRECDTAAALLGATPIHLDHPQRHYTDASGETVELRYGCVLPAGVSEDVPSILTACGNGPSVQRVVDLILEQDPACIFTHGLSSHNIEHLATCLLVTKAFWQAVDEGYRGALLHWREDYTSYGPANTKWDTFIDISRYLDRKMELLGKHACQMPTAHEPDHGHRLRPMKWGTVCGCAAAEVFTWVLQERRPDLDSTQTCYSPLQAELIQHSSGHA